MSLVHLSEPTSSYIVKLKGGDWYRGVIDGMLHPLDKNVTESLIAEQFTSKCLDPECKLASCGRGLLIQVSDQ